MMGVFIRRPRFSRRWVWLIFIFSLLACNLPVDISTAKLATKTPDGQATVAGPAVVGEQPSKIPTAVTSSGDVPTAEPPAGDGDELSDSRPIDDPAMAGPLPASLYFLNRSGQIMRLEADGVTLAQITDEPMGVTGFDVSPAAARIAYVSDNNLLEVNLTGGNRFVKVSGGPVVDDGTGAAFITHTIEDPRYSPNGRWIAFGLNGINLIDSGEATDYQVVLANDPFPDFKDPNYIFPDEAIRFFWPKSWSPDGNLLQLQLGYYPEGGGLAIVDLNSGLERPILNPEFIDCCDWSWANDGQSGFVASELFVYGTPGLAQADIFTGDSWTLIDGSPAGGEMPSPGNPTILFRQVYQNADGSLLTFIAFQEEPDVFDSGFQMHHIPPGIDPIPFPARNDFYNLGDILWSPDGRGAVIVDAGPQPQYPIVGPLRWLPADGEPAISLAGEGSQPRWGE